MFKIIKKSLITLLLVTIKIIVSICKSIYKFFAKNKPKIEKIAKGFYLELKEELSR